jgi:phosphopantothenoylcysteine decarboxylase/phosphopantothenate--cysteine ligase
MLTVLVTAGPTREHIDDVRFLSNGSTGRMGYAIAAAASRRGHGCQLVTGPTELPPPAGAEVERVTSALEMLAAVERRFPTCDVFFAAAAVADHRPARRAPGKPQKSDRNQTLELVPNPDIVATVARDKGSRVVVGFSLQAERDLERARQKLVQKHLDLIVWNRTEALGADDEEAVLVFAGGRVEELPPLAKTELAARLVDVAEALHQRRTA